MRGFRFGFGFSPGGSFVPPPLAAPVVVAALTIAGSSVEGQTLTVTPGTFSGYPTPTRSYQWKRGATNVGINDETYTLDSADVGFNITCVETATNSQGSASGTSNAIGPVTALPVIPANTALPVVSGSAVETQTISVTTGTWTGVPAPTFSYQWKRGITNVGTNSPTYVIVTADIGSTLSCMVTATNVAGSANAMSNSTGPVTALPVIPANTVAPLISGSAIDGQTLSANTGTWTGTPPPSFAYQWKRGAVNVGLNQNTYVLVTADIGASITCVVTATNTAGSTPATSNALGPVIATPVAPLNTVAPALSGTGTEGQTLSTTNGTWTGTPAPTFSYQWKRGATNIGLNQNTYLLAVGDVGANITCVVTGTNGSGSATGTSNAIGPIAPAPVIPINTIAPVVSGTTREGQTLSATTGTWTGTPAPTFAYQWRRGGVNVGTNSSTYVLVTADIGATMSCVVTGTNTAGSGTGTSNSVGPVVAIDITPDSFAFVDVTGAALSTVYESNTITLTGINTSAPLSITGGEYSINGGAYASGAGTVVNGDTVKVRGTSSPSQVTAVNVTLTIGGVSDTFTITTFDITPAAFLFTDVPIAALSTVFTSNSITVSGITAPSPISITGGTYSINGGTFTASAGTVVNGDTVQVRLTSSASQATAASATLTIGGVSDTYTVTTQDTTPTAFTFTDVTGAALAAVVTSNSITVGGINAPAPISIVGGTYSVNAGAYTASPGTVNNGDTVTVRGTSAATGLTATDATLTIGGVSDTFTITTLDDSLPAGTYLLSSADAYMLSSSDAYMQAT